MTPSGTAGRFKSTPCGESTFTKAIIETGPGHGPTVSENEADVEGVGVGGNVLVSVSVHVLVGAGDSVGVFDEESFDADSVVDGVPLDRVGSDKVAVGVEVRMVRENVGSVAVRLEVHSDMVRKNEADEVRVEVLVGNGLRLFAVTSEEYRVRSGSSAIIQHSTRTLNGTALVKLFHMLLHLMFFIDSRWELHQNS